MLEQLIFSRLIPKDVIKRFQFPSESEDNPQKREVYRDGHRELFKPIEDEEGQEQEQEEKEEQEEQEHRQEWEQGQEQEQEKEEKEDDSEDQGEAKAKDLVTVLHGLQL